MGEKKIDGRYRLRPPPMWRLPAIGKGTLQSHTHTSSHMNADKYSGNARSSSRPHTHAIVYLSGDDVRSFIPSPLLSVGGAGGGVGGGGWWWGLVVGAGLEGGVVTFQTNRKCARQKIASISPVVRVAEPG